MTKTGAKSVVAPAENTRRIQDCASLAVELAVDGKEHKQENDHGHIRTPPPRRL